MSEEKTPTHKTLFSFWPSKKRGPPTTGSSTEGTISKVPRTTEVNSESEDMAGIKKDLMEELDKDLMDTETADTVVDGFEKQMEKCFRDFKESIRASLRKVVITMNERMNVLSERLDMCMKELNERKSSVNSRKELEQIKIELNRQAQYTRKDNLRMFGVKEKDDEDCKKVVCTVINKSLDVNIVPSDIAVAHRLPKSGKQKHRPIIVRLKDHSLRWDILKVRKKLKGTGISIAEDITRENFKLMMEAQVSDCFTSVWFTNGKVKAVDVRKKSYILNLFDDFKEIVGKPKP
jgi:arginyl-tRNA synthetase